MRRHLPILPLLALAACADPRPARDPGAARGDTLARPGATTITRAHEMPAGTEVTVAGVVNVASGVVDAGFAMQEGPRAIYVAADSATRLSPGQVVRVTGRLEDRHGLMVIRPGTVNVEGRTEVYPPYRIRTKRVGETTEGMLLGLEARVTAPVVDDRPYGWKITVDDGTGPLQVFVPAHQPFDPASVRPGQRLSVTGMSAQYDSTYEVITTEPLKAVP